MGLATAACLADPLAGDGAAGQPSDSKMPQSWRSALLLRRAVSRWCYSGSVWFEGMMALRTRLIFCLVLGFICRLYILQASQSHSESWQQFFLVEILNVCFNIHSYCIDLIYFLCLLMCITHDIIGPKKKGRKLPGEDGLYYRNVTNLWGKETHIFELLKMS